MNKTDLKTFLPVLGLTSTIALVGGGVNPLSVNAATLIGNLPQLDDADGSTINVTNIKAFPFTIPSGGTYQLDDVILRLQNYTSPADNPVVQIRDNTGGANPFNSNVLAILTNPPSTSTAVSSFTFTPSTPFTFVQNATYWLYVASANGGFGWRATTKPGITPTGIATGGTYRFSTNGGTTFTDNNDIQNSFQINATEVNNPPVTTPEPATVVILIAFGLGFLVTKNLKKDKN